MSEETLDKIAQSAQAVASYQQALDICRFDVPSLIAEIRRLKELQLRPAVFA